MYALNRHAGAPPMYAQIADCIADDVEQGLFHTGDYLPSEIALSRELGVSRATITKAYNLLQERKLVARIQGSGTQVAPPPMERQIVDFTGFSQHVKEQGRKPGSQLLYFSDAIGGSEEDPVCAAYPAGQELTVIERLRLVDGEPRGIQRVALPRDLVNRLGITKEKLESPEVSLYSLLLSQGIELITAEETLMASIATDQECALMGIPKHSAIIEVFRKSFDQSGQMIEAVRARYLGSAYVYKVRLGSTRGH